MEQVVLQKSNLNHWVELMHRGFQVVAPSRVHGEIDIDHFIPWSRYPVDLGNNFVMAHRRCNQAKRDHLAAPVHLERWIARNDRHRNELEEGFRDRLILFDEATSLRVAIWAYSAVERAGGFAWVQDKLVEPLGPRWRSLLERNA